RVHCKALVRGEFPERGYVVQLPTYFAYRLRATAGSSVPLTIARPSGNSVSWMSPGGSVSRRRNALRLTSPADFKRSASSGSDSAARSAGAICTAFRPHSTVLREPFSPESHSL